MNTLAGIFFRFISDNFDDFDNSDNFDNFDYIPPQNSIVKIVKKRQKLESKAVIGKNLTIYITSISKLYYGYAYIFIYLLYGYKNAQLYCLY